MYSIISTLDAESDAEVKNLRAALVERCEPLRKTVILEPHISWLGADDIKIPQVVDHLTQIAKSTPVLHLVTTGYGIFSGPTPVLYLPIIKTEELTRLHKRLWDELSGDIVRSNYQFQPDQWLPHISVFYVDESTATSLGCALSELIIKELQLHCTIDKFHLAYFKGDQYGFHSSHYFAGTAQDISSGDPGLG